MVKKDAPTGIPSGRPYGYPEWYPDPFHVARIIGSTMLYSTPSEYVNVHFNGEDVTEQTIRHLIYLGIIKNTNL